MKKIMMILGIMVIAVGLYVTLFYNADGKATIDEKLQQVENLQKDSELKETPDSDEEEVVVSQEYNLIRTNSQGSIDVGIRFDNILENDDEHLAFSVMLNNHAIDLSDIQLDKLVSLKTNDDLIASDAFTWKVTGDGGHHISGTLKLPKKYNGKSIIKDTTSFLELEIKQLGDIESRTFKWEKGILILYQS